MARILILDDDPTVNTVLCEFMKAMGHEPVACTSLAAGIRLARDQMFELIFLDLEFPDGDGLTAIPGMVHAPYMPQVIIITGAGTRNAAEIAFRHGAWDFIRKPFEFDEVEIHTSSALRHRAERMSQAMPKLFRRDAIIGDSPLLQACLEELSRASGNDAGVLITGETGTGKELFARALHENSARAAGNLLVIDCGAIPETLAESVFFGYEKGAFTNAAQARQGLIKQAHGGTLFLDEVAELPLSLQTKLLRVLQERRFRPIGSEREVESDFRLVAATNKDLERLMEYGLFRQDLLFRINAVHVKIPPLRDRKSDIPALVSHHLFRLGRLYGTGSKSMSPESITILLSHDWPGNVRELVQVLERSFSAANDDRIIHPFHLPPEIRARSLFNDPEPASGEPFPEIIELPRTAIEAAAPFPTLDEYLAAAEKDYLKTLMQRSAGSREEAIKLSGLSQSKLYNALRQHHIPRFRVSKHRT